MDFNSNSVSSSLLPNSMSIPSYPMSQYRQEDREVNNFNLPSNFNSNSIPPNLLSKSMSMPSYPMSQYHQEDRETKNFNLPLNFNANLVLPNLLSNSMLKPSYLMTQDHQEDREANNFNIPLNFNSNFISANLLPNSMSIPSYLMSQYRQDKEVRNFNLPLDFNNDSVSLNMVSNSVPAPFYPMHHYHKKNIEGSNFNLPKDVNSNSISPNLVSNFMLVPSYPMPQDRQDKEEEKLRSFWEKQLLNIQVAEAFKSQHKLPLARIRRVMKSDAAVQMISAETPMLMSKACEIFIQELTFRAWMRAEESNKRTMQPCDVAKAILQTDALHFLTEIVPNDLLHFHAFDAQQEENAGNIAQGSQAALPHTAGFMGNPMMNNMGSDLEARNQIIPQPNMMQPLQPPFMPLDQLPYNFHPKSA
ncbi:Nuclear transcription factor Y subunit C-3, partial [Mucuna pruriens]